MTTSKPRDILSESKAMEILRFRGRIAPKVVGARYGVSEKAIRDIWNGRTWSKATKMATSPESPSAMLSLDFKYFVVNPFFGMEDGSEKLNYSCYHNKIPGAQNRFAQNHFAGTANEPDVAANDVDRLLGYWDVGFNVLLPLEHPMVSMDAIRAGFHDTTE
mmetsp:Transcript_71287/g.190330  ORF Transcript_71287/g.190330 Transcript_71287/m.190330 type:complete len:161 (-) Transcript_71287:386-868(-)|eukprot:CAMPEP_0113671082 /NCGR_PEP_ID=MMETSP0038_2-20120614/5506_1 /TAXON_ID=2898 /ORGANISM="Cryptomonas paramecium" /LENGTH=160 /DNA_ID=CAMNT_0000587193 /DNA_START=146 /DNA_END=628 /DNA_ORIENTATION=- /assembly_acc=CAM_ASM_000170